MCYQECAVYGELVRYLRDRCAGRLAELDAGSDQAATRAWLDDLIREWFFTPQDDLHGCAPRDLIWAEQKGQPNPIHPDHLDEFFPDDCPLCQAEYEHVREAIEAGQEHGWQWHYDDGGFPLIAEYDPEGWDERWAAEDEALQQWKEEQETKRPPSTAAPAYEHPPTPPPGIPPQEFWRRAIQQPWLDPKLHHVAQALSSRVDCPDPAGFSATGYRRLTYDEALALAIGLHDRGVDVDALLEQMDAFPYENVALDWLTHPEDNVALLNQAIEREIAPDDATALARFRHHRDFVLVLARIVPPGARLWLQGWAEATAHGAFAHAARRGDDEMPF